MKFNWTAAFVAYCNNHPVKEISEALGIPEDDLKVKILQERWSACRNELPLAAQSVAAIPALETPVGPADPFSQGRDKQALQTQQPLPVALKAKLDLLLKNRETNYRQACKLRAHLETLLDNLVTGKLEMEQLYHNKGMVVRTKRKVSPADMVNIATYARLIQEMTYRSLGDTVAQEGKGQDNPAGSNPSVPAIVINLPGAIALPREQRAMVDEMKKKGAKVIDVQTITAPEPDLNVRTLSETEPLPEREYRTENESQPGDETTDAANREEA